MFGGNCGGKCDGELEGGNARARGSVPGLGGLKETMFLPHPRVKVSIVGSLRDRKVACSASDRQGSNSESCVWRTVSISIISPPQEALLAQFSLYVHKGGLKPDSFHFEGGKPRELLEFSMGNLGTSLHSTYGHFMDVQYLKCMRLCG